MRSNKLVASDLTSYLERVFSLDNSGYSVRCYRGQADKSWRLKPSVMRDLRPNAEDQIISELLLEAPSEFGSDKLMFEKLVRAQHYGLPTRLLDVSLNPLVGLYFACSETEYWDRAATIQVFEFSQERVKNADSDAVSLICNLSRLSDAERIEIFDQLKIKNKSKWSKTEVEAFRKMAAMKRLTQFVRVEKPYFLDLAEPRDLLRYFFVHPYKNNRRVIAQSGAFIAAGLLQYNAPQKSTGFNISNITIPASAKAKIIDQLDILNINNRSMFPEVESVSGYIKNKWRV